MTYNLDDVSTWPAYKPLIIAHDVGRSRDRSTAVVGGNSPWTTAARNWRGRGAAAEPVWNCARQRAGGGRSTYNNNALIVADLSNDATYAEVLHETFGPA
jgi:hypothetical protein